MPASNNGTHSFLTPKEVSSRLGVTVQTLLLWRSRGEGPPWIRDGKLVLYPLDGFLQWYALRVADAYIEGVEWEGSTLRVDIVLPVEDIPEMVSPGWCARMFGVTRTGVLSAIKRGELPAVKDGDKWLIRPSDAALLWAKRLPRERRADGEGDVP